MTKYRQGVYLLGCFQGEMASIAALDIQQSSFSSHRDPKMVQWFCDLIEQRKNRG